MSREYRQNMREIFIDFIMLSIFDMLSKNSEEETSKISHRQDKMDIIPAILPLHPESAQNILNSIEVTQSRMTSEVYTFSNTSPTQQEHQNKKKCPYCAEWEAWARKSEQELVEIQNTILQKQKLLADLVSRLQTQNSKQKQELAHSQHLLTQQTNQYNKIITEKDKQISSLKNFSAQLEHIIKQLDRKNQKLQKKSNIVKKQNKDVKDMVNECTELCDFMKTEKSRNQKTATEWSFVKESNKDQEKVVQESCRSNWRNSKLTKENKVLSKTQCSSRINGLTFQNENLRSYNRVLLEKLNTHKKFQKY